MRTIVFKVREFPHLSETFIVAQIVTAIKLGFDVKILVNKLVLNDKDLKSSLIEDYKLMDKVMIVDYDIPKFKIYRIIKWFVLLILNVNDVKYIFKYFKEQPKFSLTWLYEYIFYKPFLKADIIHVQYGTNKYPFDVFKKIGCLRAKLVVTFHGHDAFFPINGFIPQEGYYDALFSFADTVTVNTPYLEEQLLNLGCGQDKIKIIPVGVDTDFFHPVKIKEKEINVLKLISVGRLDVCKGHVNCIEIVKRLTDKKNDVRLTIIGEGGQRSVLESQIRKYHLEDKVFLLGKKSPEVIRQTLGKHDIYIHTGMPSLNGLRESQGLATLEAQASGLPVVVFDSGGVKYTVHDGYSGFVCEENDIDAVVDKLEQFINNPDLIKKMGEQAIVFVGEHYSQQRLDEKWNIIYSGLSNYEK